MAVTHSADYTEARKRGLRTYRKDILAGRKPYPPVLDDILTRDDILAEVPVKIMEIPLDLVIGTRTAGRTSSFASDFMPTLRENTEFAYKWGNLFEAQMEEGIRDPIKAYEYMGKFYVMEGNKRVSVSKYVGLSSIMADVTRVLPKRSDDRANRIYYEFLDFFKVCPVYDIQFSQEGRYQKLAERLGQDLQTPWSDEVMQNFRAEFAVFTKVFHEKIGEDLGLSDGDAFLIYLTLYPSKTLMEDSEEVLGSRMQKLRNEFLTDTNNENIALFEAPEEIKDKTRILDFLRGPAYSAERPFRCAFIYDRNPDVSAWIYGHELGRNYLDDFFNGVVKTEKFENCGSQAELASAIDKAVADKNEMIFTTSPTMMTETLKAAIHYPNIKFLNCSINLSYQAVRTYYGRMHEAKFILGAVAATVADNHKIGFLADYPIYGTFANINSFAIGAAMVDPDVKIYLEWSKIRESHWKETFRSEGIRVMSGPDMIRPTEPSREYGIYKVEEDGSIESLAAPVWNWGKYYEQIIRTVLDGTWQAREVRRNDQAMNYWWGMSSGVIDVILSNHLSYYTKKMAAALKRGILRGSLSPFDGELRSQTGVIKEEDTSRLSNEEIITMSWLSDNVIGRIPTVEELNEEALQTIRVSGVADIEGKSGL